MKNHANGLTDLGKRFEIPYNNDPDLIVSLAEDGQLARFVKFIYLPCDKEHGLCNARGQYPTDETMRIIAHIQDHGFEPCILIQRNVTLEAVEYYWNLGVRYFTLGGDGADELAFRIKEESGGDAYLTASITLNRKPEYFYRLKPEDDPFDVHILPYYFNRHLQDMEKLPKTSEYGLILNATCLWNCPWILTHWFPEEGDLIGNCAKLRFVNKRNMDEGMHMDRVAYIRPRHLSFFAPYLESFKIVDRKSPTRRIRGALQIYAFVLQNGFSVPDEDRSIYEL